MDDLKIPPNSDCFWYSKKYETWMFVVDDKDSVAWDISIISKHQRKIVGARAVYEWLGKISDYDEAEQYAIEWEEWMNH